MQEKEGPRILREEKNQKKQIKKKKRERIRKRPRKTSLIWRKYSWLEENILPVRLLHLPEIVPRSFFSTSSASSNPVTPSSSAGNNGEKKAEKEKTNGGEKQQTEEPSSKNRTNDVGSFLKSCTSSPVARLLGEKNASFSKEKDAGSKEKDAASSETENKSKEKLTSLDFLNKDLLNKHPKFTKELTPLARDHLHTLDFKKADIGSVTMSNTSRSLGNSVDGTTDRYY